MAGRIMSVNKTRQNYFQWLCDIVGVHRPAGDYRILLKELHKMEFVWSIPHDDNRAKDGIELRDEYISYEPCGDYRYLTGPCTVLEMLIALARRIDFELSDPEDDENVSHKYFWEMIENLGLTAYDDDNFVTLDGTFCCNAAISALLNREYSRNGAGGLFPLRHPTEDQRHVEIWYQMNAYVEENYD